MCGDREAACRWRALPAQQLTPISCHHPAHWNLPEEQAPGCTQNSAGHMIEVQPFLLCLFRSHSLWQPWTVERFHSHYFSMELFFLLTRCFLLNIHLRKSGISSLPVPNPIGSGMRNVQLLSPRDQPVAARTFPQVLWLGSKLLLLNVSLYHLP